MIKTILFDLDGTLLPMDQDRFVSGYYEELAKVAAVRGHDPKQFVKALLAGIKAIFQNAGEMTNEDAFWYHFAKVIGTDALRNDPLFDEFYKVGFQALQCTCGNDPRAKKLISLLKERGYRIVLATNPLFPRVATESRIKWAGLSPEDFELYTTFEDFHYCKPNLNYYREIMKKLHLDPAECMMIGNDVGEDMIARTLGMQVFLVTDHLINRVEEDIEQYPHGDMNALLLYLLEGQI